MKTRSGKSEPIVSETKVKSGDDVLFVVFEDKRKEANDWFAQEGWVHQPQVDDEPDEPISL